MVVRVMTAAQMRALHAAWRRWGLYLDTLKVLQQRQITGLSILTRAIHKLRERRLRGAWRTWVDASTSLAHQRALIERQEETAAAVTLCSSKLRQAGAKQLRKFALAKAAQRTRRALAAWRESAEAQLMEEKEKVSRIWTVLCCSLFSLPASLFCVQVVYSLSLSLSQRKLRVCAFASRS